MTVARALLSVSDKTGLVEFARGLAGLGVEVLATGGTADALAKAGVPVTRTESLTGFGELLDGRVKTLHPAIHAGILARRDLPAHADQLAKASVKPIDLVVVNLYPFEKTVAKASVTLDEAVEQVDIGGVALLRSAAKNHASVAVVADPADYATVLNELTTNGRQLGESTRRTLAVKAFRATAAYDSAISGWLAAQFNGAIAKFPDRLSLAFTRRQELRYGENPHQAAAAYTEIPPKAGSLAGAKILGGKDVSHNNFLDFDSALALALEFDDPACAVIKHRNPCGCATAKTIGEAIARASAADPLSAFGGMVAVNRPIDEAAMRDILKVLETVKKFDGIVAPSFTPGAVKLLADKPKPFPGANCILLSLEATPEALAAGGARKTFRSIDGGLLVQDADTRRVTKADLKVVTKRAPTDAETAELLFAWTVAKHTVSNAIVLTKDRCTVGVGSGQVNRVGSVIIAARQAGGHSKGSALGSDAFFPYPDGVEEAGKAGVTAIIQPGGSQQDPNTIAMADQYDIAMIFTGIRHFKH